jgi:hypothetical protein
MNAAFLRSIYLNLRQRINIPQQLRNDDPTSKVITLLPPKLTI